MSEPTAALELKVSNIQPWNMKCRTDSIRPINSSWYRTKYDSPELLQLSKNRRVIHPFLSESTLIIQISKAGLTEKKEKSVRLDSVGIASTL